jgi:hypothetical protein
LANHSTAATVACKDHQMMSVPKQGVLNCRMPGFGLVALLYQQGYSHYCSARHPYDTYHKLHAVLRSESTHPQ